MHFNPRAPCGARLLWFKYSTEFIYFNPRAPCGARLGQTVGGVTYYNISIHAPRVGRDDEDDWPRMQAWPISIHAPRVGRDSGRLSLSLPLYLFQSTRPVWGATKGASLPASNDGFQSTRPVWGATSLRPRNESKR